MKNEPIYFELMELSNQALSYELVTQPSFGLVTPSSKGSHLDMDHYTFIDSIAVLNQYLFRFARLGYSKRKIEHVTSEAIQLGCLAEEAMFLKTKGINTHKGSIFVLGSLVCSTANVRCQQKPFQAIFNTTSLLVKRKLSELDQLHLKEELSHGERIYQEKGLKGVRSEAANGFPIIQKALTHLKLHDRSSYAKTLIYIMSECDDTTIIHRGGMKTLEKIKKQAKACFEQGCTEEAIQNLNHLCLAEGISPGGSADLLVGTIFLSLVYDKYFNEENKNE
jgi:triphosphoribosyl-dephospho-CoA synthetase